MSSMRASRQRRKADVAASVEFGPIGPLRMCAKAERALRIGAVMLNSLSADTIRGVEHEKGLL